MKALKCEKGRGSKAKMDEPEGEDIDLSGSVQWQEKAEVSTAVLQENGFLHLREKSMLFCSV